MNNIKSIFLSMSSWVQLLFLCVFITFGFVIASIISTIIAMLFAPNGVDGITALTQSMKSVKFLWTMQFITQLFMFLIPTLLCAYLFNKEAFKHLKIASVPKTDILLISILLIFVVQPIISFTGHYNAQMKLPEFMSGIENWMKASEDSNRILTEQMLSQSSVIALIINIFIVAIMAGLSEEFLFRGTLQQIFKKITSNYHLAVWISAIIFSAIHIQFYGFIPRLLLGALLGYIFVWSGNLWIPVIVHAVNNAMSVIIFKLYFGTPEYDKLENMGIGDYWWATLVSIIFTSFIIAYMRKQYILRTFNDNDY